MCHYQFLIATRQWYFCKKIYQHATDFCSGPSAPSDRNAPLKRTIAEARHFTMGVNAWGLWLWGETGQLGAKL